MGCLKGESEVSAKDAKFKCGKCGAAVKKKGHVCKPEKIADEKKGKKAKGCDKKTGCCKGKAS